MRDHVDHLRHCLASAEKHRDAAAVALLIRRDELALAEAEAVDESLPLAGEVLTVKACFDVAGWTTHAGSSVLADAPPATVDAPMVALLRGAGAVLLAQTNMTEFAYGALGINGTYGTPTTPLCTDARRVSGGSTAGGAVAVALGIADIALGSDTSGSARIPAAFCGVAGFKPSQGRYPDGGLIPLAPSFDVPGIIAASAAECRRIDAAITDRRGNASGGIVIADIVPDLAGCRFVVPTGPASEGYDEIVSEAFDGWIAALTSCGATIETRPMPCLHEAAMAAREGFAIAVEAFDWHRDLIAAKFDGYDRRVGPRIMLGANVLAETYVAAFRRMRAAAAQYHADLAACDADAILLPTVPVIPPLVADVDGLDDLDAYLAANTNVLRLTEYANRLNLPSISIPGNLADRRFVGLMLTGRRGHDAALLDMAVAVERCLTDRVGS